MLDIFKTLPIVSLGEQTKSTTVSHVDIVFMSAEGAVG